MKRRVTLTMLAALMAVTVFAQGGPGQGGPGQGGPGQGPRPGQGGPGMAMGRAPMPFGLLLQRDVQTELKMTETQIGQIQKLVSPGAPGGPQGGGQRGGFGGGQGQGQGGQRGGQGQGGQGQGQGGQRGDQGQGGGQRGGFGGGQQGGPGGFGMPPDERERLEREVAKILGSGQYTRFQQLALQQQGPSAMLDPKVTAKLGLSPEQVDQIRKIMQENRPQMGGPGGQGGGQRGGQGQGGVGGGQRGQGGQGQGGVGGGQRGQGGQGQGGVGGGQRGQGGQGQGNFEEMRKQMEARREEMNKKILAVLTSNQRNTWNSMLGQPFKFQQPGFGGPGGPGGQGGRGGRGGGGGGQ